MNIILQGSAPSAMHSTTHALTHLQAAESEQKGLSMNKLHSARTVPIKQTCLEKRFKLPEQSGVPVIFNWFRMWATWLLWTNQGMTTLSPDDPTLRSRVCSQLNVLSTASGLFLVIAIAGFLVPPDLKHDGDEVWINIYGCLMFTASVCLLFYTGIALTGMFPVLESMRDDVAFDALSHLYTRIGNHEAYLFFFGLHLIIIALFVAAKVIYSDYALYAMFAIAGTVVTIVTFISKEVFIALDPISSVHMGITYDPAVRRRAEVLSHFLQRKHLVDVKSQDEGARERDNDIFDVDRETALMEALVESGIDYKSESLNMNIGSSSGVTSMHGLVASNGECVSPGLTAMRVIFCDSDQHMFRRTGLKVKDTEAAFNCLVRAGCDSFDEFILYLNHHKEPRLCTCGGIAHTDVCECRQAGAWTKALTDIGIPAFHALKIVLAVKPKLS